MIIVLHLAVHNENSTSTKSPKQKSNLGFMSNAKSTLLQITKTRIEPIGVTFKTKNDPIERYTSNPQCYLQPW